MNMDLSLKTHAAARLCSPCSIYAQRAPTSYATQQQIALQSRCRAKIPSGSYHAADILNAKLVEPQSRTRLFRDWVLTIDEPTVQETVH